MNVFDPNFWYQLNESWNNDFAPQFMIGLRIFLIAIGVITLFVFIILISRGIRAICGKGEDKGSKGEASAPKDGETKAVIPPFLLASLLASSFKEWLDDVGQSFSWWWKAIGIILFLGLAGLLVLIVIRIVKAVKGINKDK